jgi:hypothetical protein
MLDRVPERRKSPRAATSTMLGYARRLDRVRFAVLGIGSTIDLSTLGLRFLAYELIPEESRLELSLVLDGRPARVADARVVRVSSRADGSHEVAVEFAEIEPIAAAAIDAYVRDRLAASQRLAG